MKINRQPQAGTEKIQDSFYRKNILTERAERIMNTLKEEIHAYWTQRAEGYSEYNQQEMADARRSMWKNKLLSLLEENFPGKNPEELKVLDVGTGPGFFALLLAEAGYQVTAAQDFADVMGEFVRSEAHLVLLDLKLPYFNGFHWCEEIRRVSQVPVIFLSSAADDMNMVMAMTRGADDFVAKPFNLEVLSAKVQAILRRTYSFGNSGNLLEHRGAVLNLGSGNLSYQGQAVELTRNELRILNLLFSQAGNVVSREAIMQMLWENDDFVDDNTLTVNVNRLRRKLEGIGLENMILTRKGLGYIVQ